MTLQEFKAWFEGYTENLPDKSVPSQKQWARIKARVAEIDGVTTTRLVYRDWYPQWYSHNWCSAINQSQQNLLQSQVGLQGMDAVDAMSAYNSLGSVDANADGIN